MMISTRLFRVLALLALVSAPAAGAQDAPPPHVPRAPLFDSVAALQDSLHAIAALPETVRAPFLDALWASLRAGNQVPFAVGDSVLFLYRGPAAQVAWAGDFTGWQPSLPGLRLADTDLWYATIKLPPDARMDYKLVLDGDAWQLDPANPLVSWSGMGPNTELRMPGYAYPAETVWHADIEKGTLGAPLRLPSPALGYDVQVRVYTPAGYDTLMGLPALYVTDGHEYAPDHLGGLVTTLDNLIAARGITPLVAVFIDPRDPDSLGYNRREDEFLANPKYASFVADELRTWVESRYRVRADVTGRVVLGTSFGGLFAAYVGAERPDVFRHLAIQSPAFWPHPEMVDRYDRPPVVPYRISLSQGTIADGDWGERLAAVLRERGYRFTYADRNEGHAWGHWRALLPGVLRYHFGLPDAPAGAPRRANPAAGKR